MIKENNNPPGAPAAQTASDPAASAPSRRDFLVGVGLKAVYMTPVLLTLTATPAVASPHSVSCKPLAGSCDSNNDCCSNLCTDNLCV